MDGNRAPETSEAFVSRTFQPEAPGFTPAQYGSLIEHELLGIVRADRERLESLLAEAAAVGGKKLEAAVRRGDRLMKRMEQIRECLIFFRDDEKRRHSRKSCARVPGCPGCKALKLSDEILSQFRWE